MRAVRTASLALLAIAAGSCTAKAPQTRSESLGPNKSESQQGGGAAARDYGDDDLDSLQRQLSEARTELSGLHVAGASEEAMAVGPQERAPTDDRCERIATLTARICELSDRMCELAAEHADQERYVAACEGAEQSCAEATEHREDCPRGG